MNGSDGSAFESLFVRSSAGALIFDDEENIGGLRSVDPFVRSLLVCCRYICQLRG